MEENINHVDVEYILNNLSHLDLKALSSYICNLNIPDQTVILEKIYSDFGLAHLELIKLNIAHIKRKNTGIPIDAPAGTEWFSGPIEWFDMTLRISGDDLDPEVITHALNIEPTSKYKKGESLNGKSENPKYFSRTGRWHLNVKPELQNKVQFETAVYNLLFSMNLEKAVWMQISEKTQIDLFIGLIMRSKNKGIELSPELMTFLGERKILIGFDIYYEGEIV